jgi:hypothetical protein
VKFNHVFQPLTIAVVVLFFSNLVQLGVFRGHSPSTVAPPGAPSVSLGRISVRSAYFGRGPVSVSGSEPGWHTAEVPWHNAKWQQEFGSLRIRARWLPFSAFQGRPWLCQQIYERFGAQDRVIGRADITALSGRCATKDGKLEYQFRMTTPQCGVFAVAVALVPAETNLKFEEATEVELAPQESCRTEAREISALWVGLLAGLGAISAVVARLLVRRSPITA